MVLNPLVISKLKAKNPILSREIHRRRKEYFKGGGGVLNVTFQKCSFCTDLFTNNSYRKCLFPPPPHQIKKGGGVGGGGGGAGGGPPTLPFLCP